VKIIISSIFSPFKIIEASYLVFIFHGTKTVATIILSENAHSAFRSVMTAFPTGLPIFMIWGSQLYLSLTNWAKSDLFPADQADMEAVSEANFLSNIFLFDLGSAISNPVEPKTCPRHLRRLQVPNLKVIFFYLLIFLLAFELWVKKNWKKSKTHLHYYSILALRAF
jgi:hypothetical protein